MRILDEAEDKTCTWSIPGTEASFTMPASLVTRLKSEVTGGLLLLPKRGAEVGGVLLGSVLGGHPLKVNITDFAPVACEYRFGPTFILSENDIATFEPLLATLSARQDTSIVGYYRSCTGREMALDKADGAMMRTYFPAPEMFVLSIKPLSLRECSAWFFFRQDGALPTVPTHPALPFDARPESMEMPVALAFVPRHDPEPPQPPLPVVAPFLPKPRKRHWLALSILLLVATAAGYRYGSETRQPVPREPVRIAPIVKQQTPPPTPPPAPAKPPVIVEPPTLIQQTVPDVPDGIRARIELPIVVNVDVRIGRDGKVTRATVQGDGDGMFRFLAERAAAAAQSSTFQPARAAGGTPVPSTEVLSFVFEAPPR